jgi:hypothetical protein
MFGARTKDTAVATTAPAARLALTRCCVGRLLVLAVGGLAASTLLFGCAQSSEARALPLARAACKGWDLAPKAGTFQDIEAAVGNAANDAAKANQLDQRWSQLRAALINATGELGLAFQVRAQSSPPSFAAVKAEALGSDVTTISSQCQIAGA